MKKQTFLRLLLDSIFLIVFNVFFFVLGGTEHAVSVWLSYGFVHLAYLMVLLTPVLTKKCANDTILWMPVHNISTGYFFSAFIVGLFFILTAPSSIKMPLLIQVAIAGCYAALLLVFLIANANTTKELEDQKDGKALISEAAARLRILSKNVQDTRVRKAVEKAYDAIHASPAKTTDAVAPIEQSISTALDALTRAVNSGDNKAAIESARTIISLAEERNTYLKKYN